MRGGFTRIISQNAIDHDKLFPFCESFVFTAQQTFETSPLRLSRGRWEIEPRKSV